MSHEILVSQLTLAVLNLLQVGALVLITKLNRDIRAETEALRLALMAHTRSNL